MTTNLYYVDSMAAYIKEELLKTATIEDLLEMGICRLSEVDFEKIGDDLWLDIENNKKITYDELLEIECDKYKVAFYWVSNNWIKKVFLNSECTLYEDCEIDQDYNESSKSGDYSIFNLTTKKGKIIKVTTNNCSGRLSPFFVVKEI